jgi:hypothetical protein
MFQKSDQFFSMIKIPFEFKIIQIQFFRQQQINHIFERFNICFIFFSFVFSKREFPRTPVWRCDEQEVPQPNWANKRQPE